MVSEELEREWEQLISAHLRQLTKLFEGKTELQRARADRFAIVENGLIRPANRSIGSCLFEHAELSNDVFVRAFYQVTDGLDLPFFDAEENYIYRSEELLRLSSFPGLVDAIKEILDATVEYDDDELSELVRTCAFRLEDAVALTPYADSGIYLLLPVRSRTGQVAFSCMFRGAPCLYENFLALMSNEFDRQVRNAKVSLDFTMKSLRQ